MSDLIDALDSALAEIGEDAILRRPYGSGNSQGFVSVTVRIKVDGLRDDQISAGIVQDELNFIMSPTQIKDAQWPGGTIPQLPPLNQDPSVPRPGSDQMVSGGKVRQITYIDPVVVGGELVRINGRMTG